MEKAYYILMPPNQQISQISKKGMVQNQAVLGNRRLKGPIFKGCVNIFSPPSIQLA
jgi:hypothetical protein